MAYKPGDVVKARFAMLKQDLLRQQNLVQEQKRKTERSMIGWSFNSYALADAPTLAEGMTGPAVAYISDGRKDGEGAGAGTGIYAYYDLATDSWLKFSNDTAVLT